MNPILPILMLLHGGGRCDGAACDASPIECSTPTDCDPCIDVTCRPIDLCMSPTVNAEAALRAGDLEDAETILARHWSSFVGHELADALRLARRIAFRKSEVELSLALTEDEVAIRQSLLDGTCPIDTEYCDALQIAFVLSDPYYLNAPELVRSAWLARLADECAVHPEEEPRYYDVSVRHARGTGRVLDNIDLLLRASELASRQGDLITQLNAQAGLAAQAVRLGRPDIIDIPLPATVQRVQDALQHFRGDVLTIHSAVTLAYISISYNVLMLRESGYRVAFDIEGYLATLRELATRKGPGFHPNHAAIAHIWSGLHAVQQHRPHQALAYLHDIPPAVKLSIEDQFWRAIVEARASLALRAWAQAQRALAEAEHWAVAAGHLERRWITALTRGALHEARGDVARAIASYRDAELLLDRIALPVAMGEARDRYIHDLQRRSRPLIALQLRIGAVEEAFCTARLARGRVQRAIAMRSYTAETRQAYVAARAQIDEEMMACHALDQPPAREACVVGVESRRREQSRQTLDTSVPDPTTVSARCEDLVVPDSDALTLMYLDLGEDWIAFAATRDAVKTVHLGAIDFQADHAALAEALLVPLADELRGASRVQILATEEAHRVDFHVLPLDGVPLLTRLPVAYSLDLPRGVPLMPSAGRSARSQPSSGCTTAPCVGCCSETGSGCRRRSDRRRLPRMWP